MWIEGQCDPVLSHHAILLSLGLRTKQNLRSNVGKEFTLGHIQEAASGPEYPNIFLPPWIVLQTGAVAEEPSGS